MDPDQLSRKRRAIRYLRLAQAEPDPNTAKRLRRIAAEAERGVLVLADWGISEKVTSLPTDPEAAGAG